MFKPISSAVSDSTMRAFSNFPPFSARAPGILPTNSDAICFAFSSSLHTNTSQSTGASPASVSAPRFWNAAAKLTPAGKSSRVCSAADPCHTPSTRVAAPPTDQNVLTGFRQSISEPGAFRSRSAQNRDFSRHECSPRFQSRRLNESLPSQFRFEPAASLFPQPVWYLQKLPRCQPPHSRQLNSAKPWAISPPA